MSEDRFGPGEVVFREGEPSRAVLLVQGGEGATAPSRPRDPHATAGLPLGAQAGTGAPGPSVWRAARSCARPAATRAAAPAAVRP
jgi:hypothetical protein